MTRQPPPWTKKQEQTLRDYWKKSLTAGQISKKMGFSRSAILGKVYRMGLPKRKASPPPVKPKTKASKNAVRAVLTKAVTRLEYKQCRFPIGDPQEVGFRFCDKPANVGKPYCAHHQSICYEPQNPIAVKKTKA